MLSNYNGHKTYKICIFHCTENILLSAIADITSALKNLYKSVRGHWVYSLLYTSAHSSSRIASHTITGSP